MHKASVFKNNTSQAIRLPKSLAFPEGTKTVDVIAVGRGRLIVPSRDSWDHWFEQLEAISDFMTDRDQPAEQERDLFE